MEARNVWLEQENTELRRQLGFSPSDPPVSGPEPELLVIGSPGESSKGEESLVKSEEGCSPPPLFGWDEGDAKGKGKAVEGENGEEVNYHQQQQGVQSWNAKRLDATSNALGFDFSQAANASGPPPGSQMSPRQGHHQHPLQFLPPPHQHYDTNPLAYLAAMPMGGFGPPPSHHGASNGSPYEVYPFSWPAPQRNAQHSSQIQHSPAGTFQHSF